MAKTYSDFMNEISGDELFEAMLAHGLFAEKFPPIFTGENFLRYCQTLTAPFTPKAKHRGYQLVCYESMRNINIPRCMSIPSPFSYHGLIRCLADNWPALQIYFQTQTAGQRYKASRIHIRKRRGTDSLFEMNYDNWRTDGSPENDLRIGMKYIVKADISNCFPSIYTHSLPWALVGKSLSKQKRKTTMESPTDGCWENDIDYYSRQIKCGETHGLPIGPHVSNLLSEIILVAIDKELCGWRFVRAIDDYTCYVDSQEKAELFLRELNEALAEYDLCLNHKKTCVCPLPASEEKPWSWALEQVSAFYDPRDQINYKGMRAYLDAAIRTMSVNGGDAAVLKYAIKVLSNDDIQKTDNAKEYCAKTFLHLALLFPYLVPLLDEYLFEKFLILPNLIAEFLNAAYKQGLDARNFEETTWAAYLAKKHGVTLADIKFDDAINSNNAVFQLVSYHYFLHIGDADSAKELKKYAATLLADEDEFERHWVFAYEVLSASQLKSNWKTLKAAGVTFLK